MSFSFIFPDLGEGIVEAEVIRWLVSEGDLVEEHQSVVEVETDKALVEVPSPRRGRVLTLGKAEGQMIKVGETLLVLGEVPDIADEREFFGIVGVLPEAEEETGPGSLDPGPGSVPSGQASRDAREILAVPGVRVEAARQGVDLSTLQGTGLGGSLTFKDLSGQKIKGEGEDGPGPSAEERIAFHGLRKTIAKRMVESLQRSAPVTLMDEFDVTELWALKKREEDEVAKLGLHLTFLPFFMKATQHALAAAPMFNGRVDWEAEEIILEKTCHFGIAVDTPEGLLVPVVKDVEKKNILELASELETLAQKARQRLLAPHEMQGGTLTLTNFGPKGGRFATPIINPPNLAILGFGHVTERPWVVEDAIVPRKILPVSFTFDHQVADGGDAGRFMARLALLLNDPGLLFLESI